MAAGRGQVGVVVLTEHIGGDFSVSQGEGDVQVGCRLSVGNSLLDVRGMERLKAFREWLDVLAV